MKTCLGKDVAVLVDTVLFLSNAITPMEPVWMGVPVDTKVNSAQKVTHHHKIILLRLCIRIWIAFAVALNVSYVLRVIEWIEQQRWEPSAL